MPRPVVHLIAHTHWDREWYLPLGAFRARLVPLLDDLIAQLETDHRLGAFHLDGQTILLEDYLGIRPEQRERVAALVEQGRLVTGPWYVLADEQIPAAESLVRNLLQGRAHQQSLGAPEPGVLYSPDAFGHPAVLPALGAGLGLTDAVVWRGLGPAATGGRDLAWWEAPDGRRLLVYHLPPDGYEVGSNLLVPEAALPAAWAAVRDRLLPRAATRHVALFVGADHHAPDPDLGRLAERLGALDPAVEVRHSSLAAFFRAARGDLGEVDLVRGELRDSYGYTWTLQGVHSTRAPLKRRNAWLELLLTRVVEPLEVMAPTDGSVAVLRQAWRELLQCHFHDTLGGCAADPVARAMQGRMDGVDAAAGELVRTAMARLAGHDPDAAREGGHAGPALVVWNPVPRARRGVVLAALSGFRRDILVGPPGGRTPRKGKGLPSPQLEWVTGQGTGYPLAVQVLDRAVTEERVDAARHYPDQDEVERVRVAFVLPEALEPLGLRVLPVGAGTAPPQEPFAGAQGRLLWNGRVELALDPDGTAVMRAPHGAPLAGLLALESQLDRGDCYTPCAVAGDRPRRATRAKGVRVSAPGPLVAGLEWGVGFAAGRGPGGKPGRVDARFRVEAVGDSPVLRIRLAIDNRATDHRLRLCLPTGLRGGAALAGAQFGCVARAPVARHRPRARGEAPVTTAPAHRWVAVASDASGLALFAPGFLEYEWTPVGDLHITLLRGVGELSRGDIPTRPGHAGWPTPTPEAQCLGEEVLEFGLAPVRGSDLAEPDRMERWWEDCFLPPLTAGIRACTAPVAPPRHGAVALEGAGLVFTAMKPAEDGDGYILRCANLRDHAAAGRWRWAVRPERVLRVRLDETTVGPLELAGNTLRFEVGAREVWSFRVLGG